MRTTDTITIIRCLSDNYAYLMHDATSGDTVLIDAPEAAPIQAALEARGWTLTHLLLTHHHADHIDGVAALKAAYPDLHVVGAAADAHRLPALDRQVSPGDTVDTGAGRFAVLDAPGHTVGHIAYHQPQAQALFSGDSLMVHGCGRLFEGSAQQMFDTIATFAALPDDTRVYSGHDYAQANLTFAARFAPDAQALEQRQAMLPKLADQGTPTVGVTLAEEKLINPYLRTHLPQVAQAAGLPDATAEAVFAEIRRQKDNA
ncbi:MAG: hydroxyacylglutathione hydrolase [Pararhodobacter sp.]|nr:hydroxyacylglutathione hydrolase [Pararhodobacter sp.]